MRAGLTPKKLEQRVKMILDTWRAAGFDVGGLVVDEDGKVTILTTEAAKVEPDEFEKWNKRQGAA